MAPLRKVVFLDVDGVLLEWFKPFVAYANSLGIELRMEDLDGYNLEKLPCWNDESHCFKTIGDFIRTPDWEHLPVITYPSTLFLLKNIGYELRVLSQVSSPMAQVSRTRCLSMVYGPVFSGIHYTTHKTSKLAFLTNFISRRDNQDVTHVYMLDDKPDMARSIADYTRMANAHGRHSIIYPVAINNQRDHPYLTKEIIQVSRDYPGVVHIEQDVNRFATKCLHEEYLHG